MLPAANPSGTAQSLTAVGWSGIVHIQLATGRRCKAMPPGGKRPGAGRPKGEPTVVLSIRVPADRVAELKPAIATWVLRWLKRNPKPHQ